MDLDELAKKYGGTTTTVKPVADLSSLAEKYGGTVTSTESEKVGGLQSFIRSVASPFLKLASSGVALKDTSLSLAKDLLGIEDKKLEESINKGRTEGYDYGYLGKVKPFGSNTQAGEILSPRDALEAAGTGAEIGSYAIGGGGAAKTLATGLKGQIFNATKEAIKTGATSGGLISFAQSLQDAEATPMDVAYNTLFGTGVGAVGGAVLGPVTPLVSKAVKGVKGYTNIQSLEKKLADGYRKIFNPTARQIKADTRFGNDSFQFLAKEMPDMPIDVDGNGRIVADDAIEMARQKYVAEATAYKPIIRNSGKYIDIDEAISNAKRAAKKEFDGTDLLKAEKQIDDEVNAYLANNPQDVNVLPNGKRFVTLSRADDIKSYSWSRGKGWGSPDAEVWNDTNNLIGHSLKDLIEKELPSAPIKAMNRRLGQWKNAIDMLERRNNLPSGSGGRFTKIITKGLGTSIGASLGGNEGGVGGGIVGAGSGFVTATALASIMSNPKVRLFVVRKILQNLQKAGRGDMIKEAEQILREQSSKYLLPAAGKSSYVEQPIVLPESMRETNLGIDEVKALLDRFDKVNN